MDKPISKSSRRVWFRWILWSLVAIAVALLVRQFVFQPQKEGVNDSAPSMIAGPHSEGSLCVVYTGQTVDYVFYYDGKFGISNDGARNTHSLSWIDKGSITLKTGKTFGFLRESVNPLHLSVNGKEYDLRQGRVLVLNDDGSVEQINLFPTLAVAKNRELLSAAISSAIAQSPVSAATLFQDDPWTATLPSGVTVEMLGVAEYPSEGRPWWRPDGSPLNERPYTDLGKTAVYPDQNERAYEFAVCLSNTPTDNASVSWKFTPEGSSAGGGPVVEDGEVIDGLYAIAIAQPDSQVTTTVKLGVAAGPWETRVESNGVGSRSIGQEDGGYTWTPASESSDGLVISCTDDLQAVAERRIIAIDQQGQAHTPTRIYRPGTSNFHQFTATFRGLRLEKVKKFAYQMRPYEWTTFKNVALRPVPLDATRTDNAVRDVASQFLAAMRDRDIEAAKRLSIGSVAGWISVEEASDMACELMLGECVEILGEGIRGLHEKYSGHPELLTHVEEVAEQGDWAAVRLPVLPGESLKYPIIIFTRTAKGWRFVTLDETRQPLATALSRRILRLHRLIHATPLTKKVGKRAGANGPPESRPARSGFLSPAEILAADGS